MARYSEEEDGLEALKRLERNKKVIRNYVRKHHILKDNFRSLSRTIVKLNHVDSEIVKTNVLKKKRGISIEMGEYYYKKYQDAFYEAFEVGKFTDRSADKGEFGKLVGKASRLFSEFRFIRKKRKEKSVFDDFITLSGVGSPTGEQKTFKKIKETQSKNKFHNSVSVIKSLGRGFTRLGVIKIQKENTIETGNGKTANYSINSENILNAEARRMSGFQLTEGTSQGEIVKMSPLFKKILEKREGEIPPFKDDKKTQCNSTRNTLNSAHHQNNASFHGTSTSRNSIKLATILQIESKKAALKLQQNENQTSLPTNNAPNLVKKKEQHRNKSFATLKSLFKEELKKSRGNSDQKSRNWSIHKEKKINVSIGESRGGTGEAKKRAKVFFGKPGRSFSLGQTHKEIKKSGSMTQLKLIKDDSKF